MWKLMCERLWKDLDCTMCYSTMMCEKAKFYLGFGKISIQKPFALRALLHS